MLRKRLIPVLLLKGQSLVKTVNFKNFSYIGDPCNTVRIFNELEVDELIILDIDSSHKKTGINDKLIKDIANECFMPLAYGGGIRSLEDAKRVFDLGFEKVCINTSALQNPMLVSNLAKYFGSQSIVISIDVKESFWGNKRVFNKTIKMLKERSPHKWAKRAEELGCGEILVTSVNREGTWKGLDLKLIKEITEVTSVPIIAHGGVGTISHINDAMEINGVSAVASGSMVVFQKKGMGVLVNFPNKEVFDKILS